MNIVAAINTTTPIVNVMAFPLFFLLAILCIFRPMNLFQIVHHHRMGDLVIRNRQVFLADNQLI